MIYLSSFKLSNHTFKNPNIYPYNVFRNKYIEPFSFAPITIFYGNNGCGKSTKKAVYPTKIKWELKKRCTLPIQTIEFGKMRVKKAVYATNSNDYI